MAVTPKPKAPRNESVVQELINKGGSVAAVRAREGRDDDEYTSVLVRLPTAMLEDIDIRAKRRKPVKVSRNAWMIESFYMRIKKEKE